MNVFAKRMTVSFVLALLVAVLISYGGMQRKAVPLYVEGIDQQSICSLCIQNLRAFFGDSPATILAYDYYSGVEFPLPLAYSVIDGRPF